MSWGKPPAGDEAKSGDRYRIRIPEMPVPYNGLVRGAIHGAVSAASEIGQIFGWSLEDVVEKAPPSGASYPWSLSIVMRKS